MKKGKGIRRATLKYDIFDEEANKWRTKYRSVNPLKKRGGKGVSLGEQEIWIKAEKVLKEDYQKLLGRNMYRLHPG